MKEKPRKGSKRRKFTSMSSYIIYVLREIAAEEEEPFTKEDEERVKARLRALGYLD